ncbi:MAG TPA: type II and III secretion system protein, partial [Candidatus Hydrogenedentes bacterium]|nr:type II and III secretion system protein [Candidatus Hydrogenedentota bacterium]
PHPGSPTPSGVGAPFDPRLRPGGESMMGAGLVADVIDSDFGTLEAAFRSLERNTDIDLISKPEILVVNNTVAEIRAGTQVPFQDLTYDKGRPQLSLSWRDAGVNMNLQPLILPNEFIQITIQELNVTDVGGERVRNITAPVFKQRSQTGVVNVPNGQSLVIGGLSSNTDTLVEQRVPILGSIPVLGIPFRSREIEADNTELLIFVSPTIVNLRDMTETGLNALNFWRERRWENTDRIQDEVDALADEL